MEMNEDKVGIEIWLYGPLARYSEEKSGAGHARLELELEAGSTLADVIDHLGVPPEERGIIFVSGNLAALPGLNVDLSQVLQEGDRVGIFHRKSMWPFQYRFGARVTPEVESAFREREDRGIHHAYTDEA
jgi:sulfur carrier protein ThiS